MVPGEIKTGKIDVDGKGSEDPCPAETLRLWHQQHGEEGQERRTVLVVDDCPIIRMVLRQTLAALLKGFDIVAMHGPEQALGFLAESAGNTAKVFTDGTMPGMRGVDFARVMRGEEVNGIRLPDAVVAQLKRVPVSLVTGDPSLGEAEFLQDLGILNNVMRKPFTSDEIASGVVLAVRRVRQMQAV